MKITPPVVTVLVSLFTLISLGALMLHTFESVGDEELTEHQGREPGRH